MFVKRINTNQLVERTTYTLFRWSGLNFTQSCDAVVQLFIRLIFSHVKDNRKTAENQNKQIFPKLG
jgi:hypothetical protein